MQTEKYAVMPSGAKLVVLERKEIRCFALDIHPEWSLGRCTPENNPDIPLFSPIASRNHGSFANIDGQWYYTDNPNSVNGTFYNGEKIASPMNGKKKLVMLNDGDILRIDNSNLNTPNEDGVLMLFTTSTVVEGQWVRHPMRGRELTTIGRGERCDIVQPLPYISALHAKITLLNGDYYLSDCGSKAGTYLNGKKVEGNVILREKDRISICDCNFIFTTESLIYIRRDVQKGREIIRNMEPDERPVVLKADIKTKKVKNNSGAGLKELIRDVRLEIRQGTLVALLGNAGAGKSTVMNCLNGMDLAGVQGTVMYHDVDLTKNFEQMKHLIGSVPQDKIINDDNTPEEEFHDAAVLRLPGDTTSKEIKERVDKTIRILGLEGVRKNLNVKLSGGERTRVNIGIELVADRELLCLDEPDQGLSPNLKHEIFEILQRLAHEEGKSVLCIVHDVSEIDMFDQVIMMVKADNVGRLAFSGTPAEARKYFGVDIRDAYALIEKNPEKYVR